MKYTILLSALIIFIFSSIAAASDLLYEKHLEQGKSALEANNFREAINEFAAALNEKPDDNTATLYFGIAHSRSGNEKEAERYLKNALRTDPLSPKVNLELGLLYEKMGLDAEARDFLMAVQELAPGTAEAATAKDHLVSEKWKIDKKRAKNWSVNLTTGVQYDSNVTLTSDDSVLPEGISDESDWRFFVYLNSNYFYPVTKMLSVGPFFSFYQSVHAELDEFNTRQFRPGLAIRYLTGNRVSLGLRYAYENTSLGEDSYLMSHNITPRIIVSEGRGFFSVLRYRYKPKDFKNTEFFTTNDERDGTNHQVQISQYIPVSEPLTLKLSYTFDRDLTDTEFWAYDGHRGYVGLRADLGKTWVFDVSGQYYRKDYDEDYPGTNEKRKDETSTLSISLTKTILKTPSTVFDTSLGYIYMDNSSNFDIFDYKRNIITFTVRAAL